MCQDSIPLTTIIDLYQKQGVPVPKIAKQYGVTRQAIYERLRKAKIRLDSLKRSHFKQLDKKILKGLYGQQISLDEIARRLKTTRGKIERELVRYKIPKRSFRPDARWKCPELTTLKVGGTMLIDVPCGKTPHFGYLYKPAKKAGMKITIRRQSDVLFKLTRIA